MRMSKTSRLLAVLLALLLALGSMPTALAQGLVISSEQYAELSDAAVQEFYDRLMAAATLEEFDAVARELTQEQIEAFFNKLSEEQQNALDEKANALVAEADAVEDIPAVEGDDESEEEVVDDREIVYPTVNYTNAAPFKDPVVGTAKTRMMMFASSRATTEADDGLELDKYVSEPDANGQYTLTLEAWATGAKVITEQVTNVPTDIILVLDQSGSMKDDFTSTSYRTTSGTPEELYNNRNNLYVKLSNGAYSPVTVSRESVVTGTSYTAYSGQSNRTYYSDRNNLYHKCSENEYNKVTVTYRSSGMTRYYTYTCDKCGVLGGGAVSGRYETPSFDGSLYQQTNTTERQYTFSYEKADGTTETATAMASGSAPAWNFYESYASGSTTRLAALKSAVTTFANSVATKAKGEDGILGNDDDVNHRIAVVGFANYSNYQNYNNTEVFIGSTGYKYGDAARGQYSNALQDMDESTGVANVSASIGALDADGATYIDLGIEMANGILNANPVSSGEKRNRVVVIFTDGVPGYSGSYDGDSYGSTGGNAQAVADAALAQVATTKNTYGATVYTVGIFTGADATSAGNSNGNATQKANYFMQHLSSNTSYPQTPSYYLSASDANALNNIFQQISENIESGGTTVTLDEESVVKDVLTEQFELPASADTDDIKVYTAEYTANGFADPVEFTEAKPSISADGKTISVTNFDFAENWVGTETAASGAVTYRGKKLIIEIPIVVRDGFLGGNGVLTNADGSGVYEDSSAEEAVEEFESPSVNVQISDQSISVAEKNVYLLGALTQDQLLEGSNITVKDFKGNNVTGDITWQADYVTVTVENQAAQSGLVDDTTYTATLTIAPLPNSTISDVGAAATAKSASATGSINVFKPVLTFQDTVRDYMTDVTGYDYDTANLISTKWMHGTTEADATMGTAPALTLTPDNEESTWITNNKVTGLSDVAVNMTVAIGDTDVTEYTTSYRNACSDSQCNYPGGNGATDEFTPEFIVHIRNIYGALKVSKTVPAVSGDVAQPSANDTFTFTVTFGDGKIYTYQKYDAAGSAIGTATSGNRFTLKNGEYVIFDKITAKTTYGVVETVDDSDYYTTNQSTITGTIVAATSADQKFTNEAVFTNTYTKLNDGNLTITKVVEKSDFTGDTFNFTVKLNDATEVGQKQFAEKIAELANSEALKNIVAWNADDKCATVTIAMDAQTKTTTVTLTDLPVGSYTVTEVLTPVQAANYKTNAAEQTVNVTKDGTAAVTVTNTAIGTYDKVDVTKTWDDNSDKLELRPKEIDVYLTGTTDANGVVYNATKPTWTTTTGDEWTGKWINVPKYDDDGNLIKYEVTETQVTNYDAPSITGNLTDGFQITNSIAVGDLAITKKVEDEDTTDDVTPDADQEFTFTVTLPEGTYNFTGSKTGTIVNGGTITLKHGESVTIQNLPKDADYAVAESAPGAGYTEQPSISGKITAGSTATAAFTNTFKVADLTITKDIVGGDTNTGDDVFTFSVKIGETTTVRTITGEGTVTIPDIPIGTSYTVTETNLPTGYSIGEAAKTVTGNISDSEDGNTATFTNTYTTGSLVISKTVVGKDAPSSDTFTFTVGLPAGTFNYTIGQTIGTIADGGTITLAHGQTATITGIPAGATYTVTETADDDYTTTKPVESGEITANAPQIAAFTNTYKTGNLAITKSGLDAGDHAIFNVRVTKTTDRYDKTFRIVMTNNETVTLVDLPYNATYTVAEESGWAWRYGTTTITDKGDGYIGYNTTDTVEVVNEKTENKWLDDESSIENKFNGVNPSEAPNS